MCNVLFCSADGVLALQTAQYVLTSIPPVAAKLYDPVGCLLCTVNCTTLNKHAVCNSIRYATART